MNRSLSRRSFLQLGATALGAAAAPRLAGAGPSTGVLDDSFDLAKWIQPVPEHAVFALPGYHVWCGTMVRAADGKCHLYYSRWRVEEGFNAWVTHSEVAHAVADAPLGPYRHVDVTLPARGPAFWDGHCTHNPSVTEHAGRFYLYYMGNRGDRKKTEGLNWSHRNHQRIGVAVADAPGGPWKRVDRPLVEPTPGFHDALMCSNPAVTTHHDGGMLMIYKAVADRRPPPFGGPVTHIVAHAPSPLGPFVKTPEPVFNRPGADFPAEDPYIWRQGRRYWAVVKDMRGYFTQAGRSLALMRSDDGVHWEPAMHVLVSRTEFLRGDGARQKTYALERPQLWFDQGEPSVLFCAASITPEVQSAGTFNVAIPLRRPENPV